MRKLQVVTHHILLLRSKGYDFEDREMGSCLVGTDFSKMKALKILLFKVTIVTWNIELARRVNYFSTTTKLLLFVVSYAK